ncbi:hypothetical protein IJJ37_02370 [Candidatus Saccharibacteria bacterium]|nr:hypothetical protein [Candidatus Saccharibacteria bacterium]
MDDNRTLEEEEIVHENSTIDFHIKNPVLRAVFYAVSFAILFGLPVLAQATGG